MTHEQVRNQRLAREIDWIAAAVRHRGPRGAALSTAAASRSPASRGHHEIEIYPPDWRERGQCEFMCSRSQLIVDDRDLDTVRRTLGGANVDTEVDDSLMDGVTLLSINTEVSQALEVVDAELGLGVVTPNHVFGITPQDQACPATEPDEPDELSPRPGLGPAEDGHGVRVAVIDTGFLQGWEARPQTPWLAGIDDYDVDDPDVYEPRGYIDPYAGHGTFVAGVVRCLAPASEVTVDNTMQVAGVIDEAQLVRQIADGLAKSPDLINLSAGGYTRRDLPPKAFVALWERRLRHHKGVVVVAAAGNNHTRHPFWPAAFPWAVSVSALTADGRQRADFSNFGGWVDVYAPGVDLVNAYAEGVYRLLLDPTVERKFDGLCKWSGTSFSTPIVTGMIAARVSRTGENARKAADALLEAARGQFLPGVGPRLWP